MAIYRGGAKPNSFKKKTTYKTKSKVSQNTKKYVKRVLAPYKPQIKRVIDYLAEDQLLTLSSPYQIYEPSISQGTGEYQRLGNTIKLTGLHIKTIFKNNNNQTNMVRMLVLSTDGSTDTTYAAGEFFMDANMAGATSTIAANTGLKLLTHPINKVKFNVYYDKVFKLANNNCTDSTDIRMINKFFRFNSKIVFEANTTGLINQNRRFMVLYLAAEGPEDIVANQTIEVTGHHHWYFTDA